MSRAKTFEEVLEANRAARRATPAPARVGATPAGTLTKADFDKVADAILQKALREVTIAKVASAVDELEALVAQRIQAHPAETRQVAVATIFQSRPELYEAVRQETTLTSHGRTLREVYARAEAGTPALTKAESADTEVARRVESLMAKTAGATPAQALAFLGREHPELMAQWGRDSYAEQM